MPKQDTLSLPNDLQQCQQIIVQMHEQMQLMQGQLDALLRARYGKKSESIPVGQLRIFADSSEAQEEEEEASEPAPDEPRKSHGRKRPLKELPRVRRVYDLPESDRACPSCQLERPIIGEEASEQYDYTPASIRVIEHVRIRRACKKCAEQVVLASRPTEVIEKGLAAPSMLAYVATSKLADHLPLNRLEGIFKRDGALISRSTMCDWMAATADCLSPLYDEMKRRLLLSEVIWTDDTPVKMQDRSDERNMRNARVWVYIGDADNPYTVFDFTESRKRDGPLNFLGNFEGVLQADAFSGYDCIYAGGKVHEAACWAHARRKFFDALSSNSRVCKEVLEMIQGLYAIEKRILEVAPSEKVRVRKHESVPILESIKSFLDRQKLISLPKSALGKAVSYALNNWSALCTFVTNGSLTIDNNRSERALRSMAVGRKNWLFMGSARGGCTNAIIASFISTCKELDIHPRLYLEDVLARLARGESDLSTLLPDQWSPFST